VDVQTVAKVKKFLAIITSVGVGILGMYFSQKGFGFEIENMAAAGWLLAFTVVVVEFLFSSQSAYKATNLTIYTLGICSYAYDIYSNFLGVYFSQGHSDFSQIFSDFPSAIFCFVVAFYIAVLPETLLVFGLIGIVDNGEGDFLKNLLKIKGKNNQNNPQNQQNQQHYSGSPGNHNQGKVPSIPNLNAVLPSNVHKGAGRPRKG
jgi:hypothetical protein